MKKSIVQVSLASFNSQHNTTTNTAMSMRNWIYFVVEDIFTKYI